MIYRVTEYDLMKIDIKSGVYYMCTDSRKLYVGMVGNVTQWISNLTFIAKEKDRLTTVRPSNDRYYYVWDTNSLWFYNAGWQIIDGYGTKSSAYYPVNNSVLTPTNDNVIDNNGLLGDGSVVVRDYNRIVKGQLYIEEETGTNELIISSFLDAGIKLLPNGTLNSAGTLGISKNSATESIGRMEFYGDIYTTTDNGETFNKVASVVSKPDRSSSSGNQGDIAIDSDYLYVCVADNTWRRLQLQSF